VGRQTPPEKIDQVVQAGAAGVHLSVIAQETELDRRTVRNILRKQAPRVNELATFMRDELMANWQFLFLDTVDALDQARADGTLTLRDRQAAAITMGIATEKSLLLAGQPTQIVAGIHEHRLALPELISKLERIGRLIGPQTGGATVPVTRSA
jgi:hypothetical protein